MHTVNEANADVSKLHHIVRYPWRTAKRCINAALLEVSVLRVRRLFVVQVYRLRDLLSKAVHPRGRVMGVVGVLLESQKDFKKRNFAPGVTCFRAIGERKFQLL